MDSLPMLAKLLRKTLVGSSLLLVSGTALADEATSRGGADLTELERLKVRNPQIVEWILEGEAALAAEHPAIALESFRKANAQAPDSALILRRQCQTLVELGQRSEALTACRKAVTAGRHGPAQAMRNMVAALMLETPTPDELAMALMYANQSTQSAIDQPWGYAARCDIAYRIGDPTMLNECQRELERLAPNHYETVRARRMSVTGLSFGAWLGWGLTAAAVVFALVRRFVPRAVSRRARIKEASLIASIVVVSIATSARAEDKLLPGPGGAADVKQDVTKGLSKWPVNMNDPASSVPTHEQRDANPLEYGYHIMDLAALGTEASKRGDFAAAARFYEATIKADPETAVGYRMACDANEKAGNKERALALCRSALGSQGVRVSDYLRYSELLFREPGEPSKERRDELNDIVKHLNADPKTVGPAAEVECELATRTGDYARLEHCAEVLEKAAPNDGKSISFRWADAMHRGDIERAQRLVALAKKTNMEREAAATMERATQAELRPLNRLRRNWVLLLVGSIGAAGVGLVLVGESKRRAKLTPAA